MSFLFHVSVFLPHVFQCSVSSAHLFETMSSWGVTSSFIIVFLVLKSSLHEINVPTPAFFWFSYAWNIFSHPFTFSLFVSLGLKWVSCKQHIYGSYFCFHSVSLYLLVGAFNPFTFKVIIDIYVPTGIFLIVLDLLL